MRALLVFSLLAACTDPDPENEFIGSWIHAPSATSTSDCTVGTDTTAPLVGGVVELVAGDSPETLVLQKFDGWVWPLMCSREFIVTGDMATLRTATSCTSDEHFSGGSATNEFAVQMFTFTLDTAGEHVAFDGLTSHRRTHSTSGVTEDCSTTIVGTANKE